MTRSESVRRWLTQRPNLAVRRRSVVVASIGEVLLIILGVVGEVALHRMVTLVIAAIGAVMLAVVIPVYRRLGLI
jgi:hypothetical protein